MLHRCIISLITTILLYVGSLSVNAVLAYALLLSVITRQSRGSVQDFVSNHHLPHIITLSAVQSRPNGGENVK